MTDDLVGRLRLLLEAATPGNLSTAEHHTECETVECPLCHEGEVEASDYCNFDGKALGVQFYGIGKEFGAHEKLWSETIAVLPTLLARIEALEGALRTATSMEWGLSSQRFIVNGVALKDENGNERFFAADEVQACWTERRDILLTALTKDKSDG